MKITVREGTMYDFDVIQVDGQPALQVSFEEDGETRTIWTTDVDTLPSDANEAVEMLDGLDWTGYGYSEYFDKMAL